MNTLVDLYTVHCFFGWCKHVVKEFDPEIASRVMQQHYDETHDEDLKRLGY